jgi:hypothetical protein
MPCSLAGRTEDHSGGLRISLKSRDIFGRELIETLERHGTVLTRLQAYRFAGVLTDDRC